MKTQPRQGLLESASDVDVIDAITAVVVGRTCWKAEIILDEVWLHWGPVQRSARGSEQGTWWFGTSISNWTLERNGELLVRRDGRKNIPRDAVRAMNGATTLSFVLKWPTRDLEVRFDNGCLLRVPPVPEEEWALAEPVDDPFLESPDWEFYCPGHMCLVVGPGPKWRYLPSV